MKAVKLRKMARSLPRIASDRAADRIHSPCSSSSDSEGGGGSAGGGGAVPEEDAGELARPGVREAPLIRGLELEALAMGNPYEAAGVHVCEVMREGLFLRLLSPLGGRGGGQPYEVAGVHVQLGSASPSLAAKPRKLDE